MKMMTFRKKESLGNSTTIIISFNDIMIGNAVYQINNSDLQLNWIEINESEQGKGFGLKTLDHIVNIAIGKNLGLIIKIVNEELLNGFYFKWFTTWGEAKNINSDLVKDIFITSIEQGDNPLLTLSMEKLLFSESPTTNNASHSAH